MTRFHGLVGFTSQGEVSPGVWEANVITKRKYYGDMLRNGYSIVSTSNSTNDDLKLSNQLSVVADSYMMAHLPDIRFVIINDVAWRVSSIEVDRHRVVMHLGEVYNGVTD